MNKYKINWIVLSISCVGFVGFGILSDCFGHRKTFQNQMLVALGFLVGICLMLVLFSLNNIMIIRKRRKEELNEI